MVLRLNHAFSTSDPDAREIFAQARQRTFMQKPREVIRSIWHKFATAEPDEQVEIFAFDFFGRGALGGFGKRGVRQAERRGIGAQR